MVVNGVPQTDIAKAMKVDPKTLRKCYRESLDHGTVLLCAKVVRNLVPIATTGRGAAAVSACRYILGCKPAGATKRTLWLTRATARRNVSGIRKPRAQTLALKLWRGSNK
jgi:hypothetical protein